MDIDNIEMKAAIQHNHDELVKLANGQRDGLKKRAMEFVNNEIMLVTEKALAAKDTDDNDSLMECLIEVEFLDEMAEAVGRLPE